MSSSDGQASRVVRTGASRGRALGVVAAAAMLLAACASGEGFRPMYAASAPGGPLEHKLAQVEVAIIPGRVGQQIRNELVFQTNTAHEVKGGARPFLLEIAIRESTSANLVRTTGESFSQTYQLEAYFRLISVKDRRVVLQGVSHGRAGFERFESIFSNVRASHDAENRAAKSVATDLKSRLATYLASQS